MIVLLAVSFDAYAAVRPDPGKNQASSWLMNSAKTLKFSSQCVNKHRRAGLAKDALMRKDPKSLFTSFLKPRSQNYCSGWLKVSPRITVGIGNIWLPDFLHMSLKPAFICYTTNQHAKTWFWVIIARHAGPSGLWHRGQAKQTAVTSLFSHCQRGNARETVNKRGRTGKSQLRNPLVMH